MAKSIIPFLLCFGLLFSGCTTIVDEQTSVESETTVAVPSEPTAEATEPLQENVPDETPAESLEEPLDESQEALQGEPLDEPLEEPLEETATTIIWEDNTCYAVINLGYRNYSPWEDVLAQAIEDYQLDTPTEYELTGDECYLVIPRYVDTTFSIYQYNFSESGALEQGDLLAELDGSAPFVLFCNPSDLYPNHIIDVTSGTQAATFSISTSLMDGSLNVMELGTDLTTYP